MRANTEGGVWLVCGPEQARGISGPGEAGFVISGAVCRVSGGAARVILAVPASRASQLGGISGSRAQITAFAKTLIGSHYLHGSGGDTPEYDDGAYYAPSTVCMAPSSTDVDFPCVFAAQLNREQRHKYGVYVCAGRCKRLGDRTAAIVDLEYLKYMDGLRETPEELWDPYVGHLSPRVVRGGNIGKNDGRPVWGEDCRHKRHFDCDSFVNYVLSHTTKASWGYTAEQYMTGSHPDYWSTVELSARPVDGDILLRGGENQRHVALLGEDNHVYQAEQHDTGVHADEPYDGKNWRQRLRILDSLIR